MLCGRYRLEMGYTFWVSQVDKVGLKILRAEEDKCTGVENMWAQIRILMSLAEFLEGAIWR